MNKITFIRLGYHVFRQLILLFLAETFPENITHPCGYFCNFSSSTSKCFFSQIQFSSQQHSGNETYNENTTLNKVGMELLPELSVCRLLAHCNCFSQRGNETIIMVLGGNPHIILSKLNFVVLLSFSFLHSSNIPEIAVCE